MLSVLKDLKKLYKGFCPFTKYMLKYGTVLIVTLCVCAVYFYVCSESSVYYGGLYTDTLYCIKQCMGSIYILPMLFEAISIIVKRN